MSRAATARGASKYLIVKRALLERIAARQYTETTPVPPEGVLAEEFEVAPVTARRAIHELVAEGFLVRAGSPEGADLISRLPLRGADAGQMFRAAEAVGKVAATMGDPVPTAGLHDRLLAQFDSPQWAKIAERCLSCANCTMVCPTCFCTAVEDRSELDGEHAERWLRWDSCFNPGHAYVHGGSLRPSTRARYRQWLTHKLAHWIDQFGTSGCVGCGRCISWCPAGIDITEEAAAIRGGRPAGSSAP